MKREEAREGDIGCFYADKSFLKVKQAFAIDKICFSFVKKGTKGDGINIYMPVDEFDLLCDKILNYSLYKKIAEEKEKNVEFPGAYTCTVGKDGTKKICIGVGKTKAADAVCIQGSVKDEKSNNMFIGTTYKELIIMAKWWQRCSIPYYSSMVADIYKASMREELDNDNVKTTSNQHPKETSKQTSKATELPKEQKKSTDKQNLEESKLQSPAENVQEIKLLSVTNTTPLEPMMKKGKFNGYACQIEKSGQKLFPVVFYNDVIKSMSRFDSFKQQLDEGNLQFSIVCTPIKIGEKDAYKFLRFLK